MSDQISPCRDLSGDQVRQLIGIAHGAEQAVLNTGLKTFSRIFEELLRAVAPLTTSKFVSAREVCAAAAHEANRLYSESLGDHSLFHWEDAPNWQKESVLNGVDGVMNGNAPEQSHEGWLKEKNEAGWAYGPVKDPEKKEHPCFVPYSDLPEAQKLKDTIFILVVRAMAEALQYDPPPA